MGENKQRRKGRPKFPRPVFAPHSFFRSPWPGFTSIGHTCLPRFLYPWIQPAPRKICHKLATKGQQNGSCVCLQWSITTLLSQITIPQSTKELRPRQMTLNYCRLLKKTTVKLECDLTPPHFTQRSSSDKKHTAQDSFASWHKAGQNKKERNILIFSLEYSQQEEVPGGHHFLSYKILFLTQNTV